MYNVVVCLLTLSFLLLTGLSNTAEARVPYEAREGVWDQKVITEMKAEVGGSCSPRAHGRGPPNRPGSSNIPGSPKRCTKP
ncbi:unnamed protein product [Arabidopsis thaliana]|uniref:(thale cress) hypothetical protein n=1 Tax=Arabidopsis thaliana TaxID=3702 RepID=A0A178UQ58_ARATH|nr:hypothetical protein AXX17_AT5G50270 [Arabidopsis thaliana]CAA0409099.1 unnamed protein product [Arabidopsis thaliana]CAD5334600.1 unnamed protein product [Arabidopsis thaliana]VYS70007.1 unnamed protein product [Arabidopsis thaliana]